MAAFGRFCQQAAAELRGTGDFAAMTLERVAALLVGRWPSGAPLVRSPESDDEGLGGDAFAANDFGYAAAHRPVLLRPQAQQNTISRNPAPINYDQVPNCTYSEPEVASIGLTEQTARQRGHKVRVGRFPFPVLGKGRIMATQEGFVKLIGAERYDELLGIHIVGPRATELIAEGGMALRLESTVEDLFQAIHAHPTLSEAMGEAALSLLSRGIHL